jgi:polyferredoxin
MKIIKNTERPIQNFRFYIQTGFAALCIWIGIQFYQFANYLQSGGTIAFHNRPPGVEGFLPISSLMSFYLFLRTGEIHPAHPAGLFIFMAIVLVSLTFGKSFCSWLCPIGYISDLIGDFGDKIIYKLFHKKIRLPKFIDYPLRSLKYLLLGFFVYAIFFLMTIVSVKVFLDSPYNQVADLKMYYFFADISRFSLIVIGSLILLSVFIKNFWCRFLCPYGALLGILSFLSPNKIKRDPVSCIDCGLCNKACPSNIKVDKVKTVISDECTTCLSCVDACPVADTLYVRSMITKKKVSRKKIAIAIVLIFMAVTGIGMITGNWQNDISRQKYLIYYKYMDSYGHPTETAAIKKFNKEAASELSNKSPKVKTGKISN